MIIESAHGRVIFLPADGLISAYTALFPRLQAAGWPAAHAVVWSLVGTSGHTTAAQLAELAAAGWDITTHALNAGDKYDDAADWYPNTTEHVDENLAACRAAADALGLRGRDTCCLAPGVLFDLSWQAAQDNFSIIYNFLPAWQRLPRGTHFTWSNGSIADASDWTTVVKPFLDQVIDSPTTILIIVLHKVVETVTVPLDTSLARLDQAIAYLQSIGCTVTTFGDIAAIPESAGRSLLSLSGAGAGTAEVPPDPPGAKPFNLGLSAGGLYVSLHNSYPTTFAYSATITDTQRTYYPLWGSKLRTLLGLSLAGLADIAAAAASESLPYDCLGYNLESNGDPDEVANIVAACTAAAAIAAGYSKPLLIGLGGRLADEHPAEVPGCAAQCTYWLLQGQRQQVYPPQGAYKTEISSRLDLARAGNPSAQLIVQVTTWAGYLLTAEQVHAFVQALVDLDPTYSFHSVNLADFHDPNPPAILTATMALYYS